MILTSRLDKETNAVHTLLRFTQTDAVPAVINAKAPECAFACMRLIFSNLVRDHCGPTIVPFVALPLLCSCELTLCGRSGASSVRCYWSAGAIS